MPTIALANGRGVAVVDDADVAAVSAYRWSFGNGYAVTRVGPRGGRRAIYMHRLIMRPPSGMQVDHINRNKLDNRRVNLRTATQRDNRGNVALRCDNTSGFRGVMWDPRRNRWYARIADHGRSRFIGYFDRADDAARAFDQAAVDVFGQYAWTNFPLGEQPCD